MSKIHTFINLQTSSTSMRIWSLHPKYLDSKGIVALWRETLLAKHVLEGKTKGYKNHPQLLRFKNSTQPIPAINQYLSEVYFEATARGFNFDISKFSIPNERQYLPVNSGQLEYEFRHLLAKLKVRDTNLFEKFRNENKIEPHPLFQVIEGEIESWEIIK